MGHGGFRLPGENLKTRMQLRSKVMLIAVSVLVAAAGCGGDSDDRPEQAEADTIKVGLITDLGQLNDRGFNQLAFEGLKRAQRELGVEVRVVESRSSAEYVPNLTTLARQGFDLVIGVGFAQGDAVNSAATTFPQTRFAIIDVDQSTLKNKPKNVVGLLFKEEEAGYLAGYLAGRVERRRAGKDVIGTVGGFKEPPVDRFIAGYQAGARRAAPGITLLNNYSSDWDDQAKCKELALNEIARGAGVVFQVAGGCGLGALDAARERNVWGIGVDADQSFLGPHILTSAQKKVDRAVFLTIESVLEGSWRGGRNLVFGLEQDGVGLGTVSSKIPRADLNATDTIRKQIVEGRIEIPRTLG
jgi:basic membrane protein A